MAENTASETCTIPSKRARSISNASPPRNKHLKKIPCQPEGVDCENTTPTSLPMKRRVNPDSLASRLEPDLVRDMNALIVPGNTEMPTFAVRKELQERYNIDRRHIYDYFHSMGLRVVKEDKLNNLVRRTDRSIKANPRPIRQAPLRGLHAFNEFRHKKSVSRGANTSTRTIRVQRASKSHSQTLARDQNPIASATSSHQFSGPHLVNPLEHSCLLNTEEDTNGDLTFPVNPLFDGFSLTRAIGDVAYSYRAKNVFTRMSELRNLQRASPDTSRDFAPYSPKATYPETDIILPLERNPLSPEERMAIYKALDDNLGAACGIEESVGTYNKYMKERSRVYFERLFRSSSKSLGRSWHQTGSVPLDMRASGHKDPVDFRKWLLCGPTISSSSMTLSDTPLCTMNKVVSPCSTPRKMCKKSENSAPSMADRFDQSPLFCFSPPINRGDEHTFDDLFPELAPLDAYHLQDSLESPVVHSGIAHLSAGEEDQKDTFDFSKSSLLLAESHSTANTLIPTHGRMQNCRISSMLPPSRLVPRVLQTGQSFIMEQTGDRVMPSSTIMPHLEQNNRFPGSIPRFNRAAAARELRTRSSGTISARLRTTSAGGGM